MHDSFECIANKLSNLYTCVHDMQALSVKRINPGHLLSRIKMSKICDRL
jgi:hypothetical protein